MGNYQKCGSVRGSDGRTHSVKRDAGNGKTYITTAGNWVSGDSTRGVGKSSSSSDARGLARGNVNKK